MRRAAVGSLAAATDCRAIGRRLGDVAEHDPDEAVRLAARRAVEGHER